MNEIRSPANQPISPNSLPGRPDREEFRTGTDRPKELIWPLSSRDEAWLLQVGGEENLERLIRAYPDGIPWYELPLGC
jgi:hypothetical protein